MKAQTFIEYFEQYQLISDTSLIFECDEHRHIEYYEKKDLSQLFEYQKFVSQPFRPEMIERLFEEFEKSTLKSFFSKSSIIRFHIPCENFYCLLPDKYSLDYEVIRMPKTLNDFISDCQRAGIDLEFKVRVQKLNLPHTPRLQ